ncbi:YihY/virulence factor BrkB family protein [bacterium]|nr:YihY/virulence factor BrkB family protein [bacterium]
MSARKEKLSNVSARIVDLRRSQKPGDNRGARLWISVRLWFWMLYHEFLCDDVNVRAQSLAYLTLFSLLPLIAGAFFIFAFFSQFGMVQDALQRFIDNFLSTIPSMHREGLRDYILHFKDSYLENLTRSSGSVGVFAILVLGWVGLQAFNNIDSMLNYIWSAERERLFLEKARNFIVVAVLAPLVLIAGFSIPLILARIPMTRFFLENIPVLNVLLNHVIPYLLSLGAFFCMYRFVPVCRVWWRSALVGALFSTLALGLVNALMGLYFSIGTNSAYGKAAVVPLVGFWIYAVWVVVILGAEVSFLVQNGRDIGASVGSGPALSEGRGLLAMLVELLRTYREGSGAVSLERLRDFAGSDSASARRIVEFLQDRKLIVEVLVGDEGGQYALARDPETLSVSELLQDFFASSDRKRSPVDKVWRASFESWLKAFDKTNLAELAAAPPEKL